MKRPDLPLKEIAREGIPAALEKAERYRLLNDPEQAESICRDILAVDAGHQDALRAIVLALTDQFAGDSRADVQTARGFIAQLTDEYDRAYYTGIACEREFRGYLRRPGVVRSAAYDGFREAMACYERAEQLRPGTVDAMLRWNSCVRTIVGEHLEPADEEREQPLE